MCSTHTHTHSSHTQLTHVQHTHTHISHMCNTHTHTHSSHTQLTHVQHTHAHTYVQHTHTHTHTHSHTDKCLWSWQSQKTSGSNFSYLGGKTKCKHFAHYLRTQNTAYTLTPVGQDWERLRLGKTTFTLVATVTIAESPPVTGQRRAKPHARQTHHSASDS